MEKRGTERLRGVNDEASIQYDKSAFNVNARRVLFDRYSIPEIGYFDPSRPELGNWGMELEIMRALQRLGYDGTGRLGDVGCGDARFVERYVQFGHPGEIWAINYPRELFYPAEQALREQPNVRFSESRAEDLRAEDGTPIPDDYFDVVTQNSLLYHLEDYESAIGEAYRVLAPGGLLLITTKDEGHQRQLWSLVQGPIRKALGPISEVRRAFEETEPPEKRVRIPKMHNILPPESFYSHFNFDVEAATLPRHGFIHTGESFRHFAEARVPNTEEGRQDIMLALFTFKDMYTFPESGAPVQIPAADMMTAIKLGGMPSFNRQVARNGRPYFRVDTRMGFDIWQKPLL